MPWNFEVSVFLLGCRYDKIKQQHRVTLETPVDRVLQLFSSLKPIGLTKEMLAEIEYAEPEVSRPLG